MTSDEIVIRLIRPEESTQIVSIHKTALPAGKDEISIYMSEQAPRYFADIARYQTITRADLLFGMWREAVMVGYLHIKVMEDSWHLNYIAILPEFRDRGLGRRLLERWITLGRESGQNRLTLDVDEDNRRATEWYMRRGFRVERRTWTYERELIVRQSARDYKIDCEIVDSLTSEAWQTAYGFSSLKLRYQGHEWIIGRLGRNHYSVKENLPMELETLLSSLDPNRRLVIASNIPLGVDNLRLISVTNRMICSSTEIVM